METGNKLKKDVIIVLVVFLILGFGYLLYTSRYTPVVQDVSMPQASTPSVQNTAPEKISQLPDGFPSDIPIETGAAIEAYKNFFKEQNATRYVVIFDSSKSKSTEWDLYNSYMNQAGYTLSKSGTSKTDGVISGTKGNDSLFVSLSSSNKETSVQLHLWTESSL
jgi:hypothetical protein